MIIKKSIYPKTKRYALDSTGVTITEKLDGSSVAIFKLNELIHVAQRNNIMTIDEDAIKNYKGMSQWFEDNISMIDLCEGSCICGEWMGMGQLKYPYLDKKIYMFAKANVDQDLELTNVIYNHEHFIYPFESGVIPDCIGVVPVVCKMDHYPTIENLNNLYAEYASAIECNVEGFVIEQQNSVRKYLRMKNGKPEQHREQVEFRNRRVKK